VVWKCAPPVPRRSSNQVGWLLFFNSPVTQLKVRAKMVNATFQLWLGEIVARLGDNWVSGIDD
jgi:hypothetical protein